MNSIEELVNSVDLDGAEHEHDWWVFGMRNYGRDIGCQCHICGAIGLIRDHSLDEFEVVIEANSMPYKWQDNGRVRVVFVPNTIDGDDWIPLA